LAFSLSQRQAAPMPDPIFIVGYWRSGTTHLHNLMGQCQHFGYITPLATGMPWDILGIVRSLEPLLEKALPQDRYVDNVAVTPTSPQEDSIPWPPWGRPLTITGSTFPNSLSSLSAGGVWRGERILTMWIAVAALHRHLLQKVSIHQGQKPLLIKNPVYTGYIRHLRELWPQAKFIHIYRNPYRVFPSARHYFHPPAARASPASPMGICPSNRWF
jgi:hypothetical protein